MPSVIPCEVCESGYRRPIRRYSQSCRIKGGKDFTRVIQPIWGETKEIVRLLVLMFVERPECFSRVDKLCKAGEKLSSRDYEWGEGQEVEGG